MLYMSEIPYPMVQCVTLSGDSKSTEVGVGSIIAHLLRAASALGYTQHMSRALGHTSHDPL